MLITSLIVAQAAMFGVEPLTDPMAGITPEWQLCFEPDDKAKTCRALAAYTKTEQSQFTEVSRFGITGLPGLILEVQSTSYVKNGSLCGVMQRKDLDSARIIRHVDGATPKQEAAAIKSIQFLYPIEGKELCSAFYPDGEHFRLEVRASGKLIPELTTRVRWVHKDDGYTIAGWQGAITTPMPGSR